MSGWISVIGWRQFQHYDPAKRVPPWIKNHTELMANDDYLGLSEHRALMLHRLWLEYATSRCRLSDDTAMMSRRLAVKVTRGDLQALCDAGFIAIVASKALAEGYHVASSPLASRAPARSREEEAEEEEVITPSSELQDVALVEGRGNGWVDNLSSYTGCRYVRGEYALTAIYDVLGTERPPSDWPHERPSRKQILQALTEQAEETSVA